MSNEAVKREFKYLAEDVESGKVQALFVVDIQMQGNRAIPTVRILGAEEIGKEQGEAIREALWQIAGAMRESFGPGTDIYVHLNKT